MNNSTSLHIISNSLDNLEMSDHLELSEADQEEVSLALNELVSKALSQFFDELEGEEINNLYSLVMTQVEAPLLKIALDKVNGNQTKAAALLGINRGTFRKKLKEHALS